MDPLVLVVGANSTNGKAAIKHLLESGVRVRGASRNPDTIDIPDVEPVRLDFLRPSTYLEALDGVDRMYLVVPEMIPNLPWLAGQLIEAAVRASVERIVYLSGLGVDQMTEDIPPRKVETSVMAMSPEWVILRPNWFMQNFSEGRFYQDIVEHQRIALPVGDAQVSFVDVDDIGAAAAAALTMTSGLDDGYPLTGPEPLTFSQVASIIGEACGRDIRYRPLDPDDPDLMEKIGMPEVPRMMADLLFGRVRAGMEAPVLDGVERLTGRKPGTFAGFAARNPDVWKIPAQIS